MATGTAAPLPDDDAHRRLEKLPRFNSLMVRILGTELLTIRIDLDPRAYELLDRLEALLTDPEVTTL